MQQIIYFILINVIQNLFDFNKSLFVCAKFFDFRQFAGVFLNKEPLEDRTMGQGGESTS